MRLTPRAAAVLALLLERAQQIVTKRELIETVWEGNAVGDEALTSCVQELRRALGDDAREPRYIETRHRRGYRLIVPVTMGAPSTLALPDRPSIAVMPFQNMGDDPEQEYFVDGLVEDITTALSRFKSLFVIARNSSFAFKGKIVDIKHVARELGVHYLLEGSVRRAGSRLRITGQLIHAETGGHIWAERYDGDATEVFELQDRITLDVVGAIAPRLEHAEIERGRHVSTTSLRAYDCHLRGIATYYRGGREAVGEALQLFYRAIELDPNYAPAYGMAVRCYVANRSYGWQVDPAKETVETAALVQKAISLAGDDALVLTTAATGVNYLGRDLDLAASLISRALTLNANLAMAWAVSGFINVWLGKAEVAIEQFSHAMRLSPLDPNVGMFENGMAHACFMTGRYEQAIAFAAGAAQRPQVQPMYRIGAASAAMAGNGELARTLIDRYMKLEPERRVSTLKDVLGPYRRAQDIAHYKEGLRRAGLPE